MTRFHLFFLFVFVATVPVEAQDVYSWVDESGVRHFSDTSPTSEQPAVSVKPQIQGNFHDHRLYRIKDGYGYCGSMRLPDDKEKDPRTKLINLLLAKKSITLRKQNLEQDLHKLHKQEINSKKSTHDFARIEETREECNCFLNWIEQELQKLEKVKDQIIMEARQAEYDYAKAQKDCGPEPVARNNADPEVVNWAKCTMSNVNRNNRLLKEKNEALGREQMLNRSMQ